MDDHVRNLIELIKSQQEVLAAMQEVAKVQSANLLLHRRQIKNLEGQVEQVTQLVKQLKIERN